MSVRWRLATLLFGTITLAGAVGVSASSAASAGASTIPPPSIPPITSPTMVAAVNVEATICTVIGSMHLSGGYHLNPLDLPSGGSFSFNSTVLACAGDATGITNMASTGTYNDTDPYNGSFATGPFQVGGPCTGNLNGQRDAEGVFLATLSGVVCSGWTSARNGVMVTDLLPNLTTLNTCGAPGPTAPDELVCDTFMQGVIVMGT